MDYTAEKYVEAEVSCSINLKVSVAWPSLHQADSGGRHLLLRRIDDPCFFLKMKSPAVVPQSLRVFFLSPLVVCFLWQYVSSHITLIRPDSVRFSRKDGTLDVPFCGPFRIKSTFWGSASSAIPFREQILSQITGKTTCLPNARLVWSNLYPNFNYVQSWENMRSASRPLF